MEALRIVGGTRLRGEVRVPGAKNSALKLMAAALLAPGRTTLRNVPDIVDVEVMAELLRRLGCAVSHERAAGLLHITVPEDLEHRADYDLVRRLRASIAVLGPLMARLGQADIAVPGGDAIGSRGLDIHLRGLTEMGAVVTSTAGYLHAAAPNGLRGITFELDFPSVGATETLVTAALGAAGTTRLENCAREPDVADLCSFLVAMGAPISGIGTDTLVIEGDPALPGTGLVPVEHVAITDRIVAGTWAVAATMTAGEIDIRGARPEHLRLPLATLVEAGAEVEADPGGLRVRGPLRPRAVDAATLPYPGFPTDLQPHIIALNAIAEGSALVTENLFEARFRFVAELSRLGAQVRVDGHHCLVHGVPRLSGAPVEGTDIRAAAALVLAGLVAEGTTYVTEVHHIDRGYADFAGALCRLGAEVERVELTEADLRG